MKQASIILLLTLFSGCTIFKKSISKPVTVFVKTDPVMPSYNTLGAYVKYVGNVSDEVIANAFMENFLKEGRSTTNVTLVNDPTTADFTLELQSFDISERSNTETISDPKSSYNGQSVMLNTVECSTTFKVTNNKHKDKKLMSCSNSKQRSEKVKNNRDLGDLVTGSNKDHTKYRTKLLADDICLNLAQDVGRRVWVPITRRIAKNLK